MKPAQPYTDLPEVPRHRKPGKRVSDSKKRADHKHNYEDSISVIFNCINGDILNIFPSKHCSVCGRNNGSQNGWWHYDHKHDYETLMPDGRYRPMTIFELKEKYPGLPLYTNGLKPNHIDVDIRIG